MKVTMPFSDLCFVAASTIDPHKFSVRIYGKTILFRTLSFVKLSPTSNVVDRFSGVNNFFYTKYRNFKFAEPSNSTCKWRIKKHDEAGWILSGIYNPILDMIFSEHVSGSRIRLVGSKAKNQFRVRLGSRY